MKGMNQIAELFHRLTYGVYVVGVATATSAAGLPLLGDAGVVRSAAPDAEHQPENASYELLHAGRGFTVNVLKRGQLDLAHTSAPVEPGPG